MLSRIRKQVSKIARTGLIVALFVTFGFAQSTPPRRASELSAPVPVVVDYSTEDTLTKAIEAANFSFKFITLDPKDVPMAGRGKVELEVYELRLHRTVGDAELAATVEKEGLVFADPLTVLAYATKLPDRQWQYPLGVLFRDKQGRACYLVLTWIRERGLAITTSDIDGGWDDRCRFLVLKKPKQ